MLELLALLTHSHVAIRCDNTPAVAWTSWPLSSKALVAAHLLCALTICMLACESSPLAACYILGELNTMADMASWSFTTFPSDCTFLTHFSSIFELPQGVSWNICACFPTKHVERSSPLCKPPHLSRSGGCKQQPMELLLVALVWLHLAPFWPVP